MNNTEMFMEKVRNADAIEGWILDQDGNKEINMQIFDWDETANTEEDMSDIVIQGNVGTIFHDDLDNARFMNDNEAIINNHYHITFR